MLLFWARRLSTWHRFASEHSCDTLASFHARPGVCCGDLILGKLLEGSSPCRICSSELLCDVWREVCLSLGLSFVGLLIYELINDEMKYLNKKTN